MRSIEVRPLRVLGQWLTAGVLVVLCVQLPGCRQASAVRDATGLMNDAGLAAWLGEADDAALDGALHTLDRLDRVSLAYDGLLTRADALRAWARLRRGDLAAARAIADAAPRAGTADDRALLDAVDPAVRIAGLRAVLDDFTREPSADRPAELAAIREAIHGPAGALPRLVQLAADASPAVRAVLIDEQLRGWSRWRDALYVHRRPPAMLDDHERLLIAALIDALERCGRFTDIRAAAWRTHFAR